MKNSNTPCTTLRWFDLPTVAAIIQPHLPAAAQCFLEFKGRERAHVLLLADGIFSFVAHGDEESFHDDVFVGLGRVIASHAALGRHLLGEAALQHELRQVEATGNGPLKFGDWPGVTFTLGIPQPGFAQCALRSGPEAALAVLIQDNCRPFGWVRFSSPAPGRRLLGALGRILAVQHMPGGSPAV